MTTPETLQADATALVSALTAELGRAYAIGEILSSGQSGVTVSARDRMSGRDVTLKVAWNDPEARARVLREAELTAKVIHASVLTVRRVQAGPLAVVEKPLMTGRTIGALLDARTPLPYAGVVELLKTLAGALDQAHSVGIVHGSLRPEAIFISAAGKPMLTDFTLSTPPALDGSAARPSEVGMAAYMSIEQRHDDPKMDGRTDQYALAVIAYELLRGERTWRVNSDGVLEIETVDVALNRPVAPGVPVAAGMAIRRASSRDSGYRYPTVIDFVRAFESVPVAEAPTVEHLYVDQPVLAKRHSSLWLAIPAVIAVAAGLTTYPSVRTAAVRLFRGEWPFAKAEYLQDNTVTASGGSRGTKVASTETRQNSSRQDSSKPVSNTRVGDGPNTPERKEDSRQIDPFPRTKTTKEGATARTQAANESPRVNPPKSDPEVVAPAGAGRDLGISLRPGAPRPAPAATSDSTKRLRDGSISVVLDDGGRAIVLIDGQVRGTTPLVWKGLPGQHVVTLRGVNTTPASISISATEGDTVRAVFSRVRP